MGKLYDSTTPPLHCSNLKGNSVSKPLNAEQLDALRRINSPTISNAIEVFNVRPRNQGFLSPDVRSIFPELGVMVGYAVTVQISADQPAAANRQISRAEYWQHVVSVPEPRVVVVQDLDNPPAIGSFWGEVNANVHKALGCVGTVTNGSVRDLDEMRGVPFFAFASTPSVSHAYVHVENFGVPVKIGGVVIRPGDLIHADQHGVIVIPNDIAAEVAQASDELDAAERKFINYCKSSNRTMDGMAEGYNKLRDELAALQKKYARS
jgi:regulator of RNase E activity RraA